MLSYNNNPEATAATVDSDGWLHTEIPAFVIRDRFEKGEYTAGPQPS